MSARDVIKVNGFSNRFWGWGGEDDDLFYRILAQHPPFYREKNKLGRFKVSKISSK